ncbi:MAG: YdcF family protein [Proteobacteria bacterium]|nr:YdcF family protein [Pseudomonadota bacterium]MBU1709428.1 YdcF family protein [Pseudomonadota bacterium]
MDEGQSHTVPLARTKRIIILVFFSTFGLAYAFNIYPFLVINQPVNGEILVVEGWIPSALLEQAAELFNHGSYTMIASVGGPSTGETADRIEQTDAYRGKNELIEFGVPAEKIVAVPVWELKQNRTFTTAKAFSLWLNEVKPSVKKIDVFTASVHGRKSRLLFRRALGDSVQVGIISANSEESEDKFWFRSKRMLYLIPRNTLGYLYALLFTF